MSLKMFEVIQMFVSFDEVKYGTVNMSMALFHRHNLLINYIYLISNTIKGDKVMCV